MLPGICKELGHFGFGPSRHATKPDGRWDAAVGGPTPDRRGAASEQRCSFPDIDEAVVFEHGGLLVKITRICYATTSPEQI